MLTASGKSPQSEQGEGEEGESKEIPNLFVLKSHQFPNQDPYSQIYFLSSTPRKLAFSNVSFGPEGGNFFFASLSLTTFSSRYPNLIPIRQFIIKSSPPLIPCLRHLLRPFLGRASFFIPRAAYGATYVTAQVELALLWAELFLVMLIRSP